MSTPTVEQLLAFIARSHSEYIEITEDNGRLNILNKQIIAGQVVAVSESAVFQ